MVVVIDVNRSSVRSTRSKAIWCLLFSCPNATDHGYPRELNYPCSVKNKRFVLLVLRSSLLIFVPTGMMYCLHLSGSA